MTEYGPKDPDTTAYDHLVSVITGYEVTYILHHARVSPNARSCQWPGSVKVQAVLAGGKAVTVVQLANGELNTTRNWYD
jgi:hypothetical protein